MSVSEIVTRHLLGLPLDQPRSLQSEFQAIGDGFLADNALRALIRKEDCGNIDEEDKRPLWSAVSFLENARIGLTYDARDGVYPELLEQQRVGKVAKDVFERVSSKYKLNMGQEENQRYASKISEIGTSLRTLLENGEVTEEQLSEAITFFENLSILTLEMSDPL